MTSIRIKGDGVAAYCSAHLLGKAGFRVSLRRTDRPRLPAIMLSDAALALIREVFERPDVFRDSPRIQRRIVAWGKTATGSAPLVLEHSAAVVSEQSLLASLGQGLQFDDDRAESEADWTIFASPPLPGIASEQRFGSRIASAVQVDLREGCDSAACCIESLEDGWLFLIPDALHSGWLLAVGSAGPERSSSVRETGAGSAATDSVVPLLQSSTRPERPTMTHETGSGPAATGSVVRLLKSGTRPERSSSVRETGAGPTATGPVVPLLESGTGPERPSSVRETGAGPAATGSVVPLLEKSRLIAQQIASFCSAGQFPAYPRIVSPLCGPGLGPRPTDGGWLACGTAAMAFDPICGDGTAHAIREAILAAAVIRAAAEGGDERELLSHYEARLTAGFQRHLGLCREYYKAGHSGPWWDAELESLERGLELFSGATGGRTAFRYQLNGFELRRLG